MTEQKEIIDARTEEIIPAGSPNPLPQRDVEVLHIDVSKVGTLELTEEQIAILTAPLEPGDVQIRPDGLVYLPWTWHDKRLNKAIGFLKWGLVPQGAPQMKNMGKNVLVVWTNWLVINGVPVAMAGGECSYDPTNYTMSYGDAIEGARSNALSRCCKHLGMPSSDLWDAEWVANWKSRYAEQWTNDKGKKVWRKKSGKATKPENSKTVKDDTVATETVVPDTQEEAVGLTAHDLKLTQNVNKIKEATGLEVPKIVSAINAIPKGERRTVDQIIKELTGA